MAFNRDDYVWPEGRESWIPPSCFRADYSNEDKVKFDRMVVHILNTNMRRMNIPFKVSLLFSSFDTRCRSQTKCSYEVHIRHARSANFDYSNSKRAKRIARDITRACFSVDKVSHMNVAKLMYNEDGGENVHSTYFKFSMFILCSDNHSLKGEYTHPADIEDFPHLKIVAAQPAEQRYLQMGMEEKLK